MDRISGEWASLSPNVLKLAQMFPTPKVRNYLANKTSRFPPFAFFPYEILNVTFSPKNLLRLFVKNVY